MIENRFKKLYEERKEQSVEKKEFTMEKLRKSIGYEISQATFSRKLSCEGIPKDLETGFLIAYADYFGVTTDYLLCRTDIRERGDNIEKFENLGFSSEIIDRLKNMPTEKRPLLYWLISSGNIEHIINSINIYLGSAFHKLKISDGIHEEKELPFDDLIILNQQKSFIEFRKCLDSLHEENEIFNVLAEQWEMEYDSYMLDVSLKLNRERNGVEGDAEFLRKMLDACTKQGNKKYMKIIERRLESIKTKEIQRNDKR